MNKKMMLSGVLLLSLFGLCGVAVAGGAAAPVTGASAQVQPATPDAIAAALREAGYTVTMNLLNQGLDYGILNLDPVEPDEDEEPEEDAPLAFAVLGRSVLWLPDLGVGELDRLREHLRRFEAEVTDAMERTLHGGRGLSA